MARASLATRDGGRSRYATTLKFDITTALPSKRLFYSIDTDQIAPLDGLGAGLRARARVVQRSLAGVSNPRDPIASTIADACRTQEGLVGLYGSLGAGSYACALACDLDFLVVQARRRSRLPNLALLAVFDEGRDTLGYGEARARVFEELVRALALDPSGPAPCVSELEPDGWLAFRFAGEPLRAGFLHAQSPLRARRFLWPTLVIVPASGRALLSQPTDH